MSKDLDIRMLIEVERAGQWFHVYASPCKWEWRDYESDRGWRFDRGFDYDEPAYNNLRVSSQGDIDGDEPPYAWRVEYHQPYSVQLADAEKMVKILRKIERGLDKMRSELDSPQNIGQFIARVGKTLGITKFGFFPPRGEALWASGERVRWEDASWLDSNIRSRIEELRKH